MKLFRSEVAHHYGSYTFAYAEYAQMEPGDDVADFYARGYLPYSGAEGVRDTFYMARSARVELDRFSPTSENRRIAKKFDGSFQKERAPVETFRKDDAFLAFCLDYFAARHGASAMPRERLLLILASGLISSIITYRRGGVVVAYVLEVAHNTLGHYWYSFYDLSLVNQSLGMWLMLDAVRDAQKRGLSHYYLGTVYGEKALYKTNFECLTWWDGSSWSNDVALLRRMGRSDSEREMPFSDLWKKGLKKF